MNYLCRYWPITVRSMLQIGRNFALTLKKFEYVAGARFSLQLNDEEMSVVANIGLRFIRGPRVRFRNSAVSDLSLAVPTQGPGLLSSGNVYAVSPVKSRKSVNSKLRTGFLVPEPI